MNATKTELRFFTVPEWEKEEAYLRQRHQEGWRLVRVTFPGLYHFQRDFLFHAVCQTDGGFWCEVDQLGNRLRGFSLGAAFQIFSHGNQG